MSDGSSSTKLPAPFGKYLLTQLIAVGGMAEVYRAKIFGAQGFEKEMVVKRILPKYAQNPSFVQMLIDEAKIAVSLSHGNIVPIYELGEIENSYYIAMEYVEGRTILDILRDAHAKKHPLPWAYCLGIAADVAKGLAYAHSRTDGAGRPLGLVHRDINPRNIVVTPAGEVRILDFGIARASTKRHQTASGVIKGTPGYMSPEQMYGKSVDMRSDIYCLGILVYELLTLRRLFPVWDVGEMRAVFEAGPIPLPSALAPYIGTEPDGVIMKALTQDVRARFQHASEFEEELRRVIARSGTAVTASGLAREIRAIDDAPGAPAPKTSPPVPLDPTPASDPSSEPEGPPTSAQRPTLQARAHADAQQALQALQAMQGPLVEPSSPGAPPLVPQGAIKTPAALPTNRMSPPTQPMPQPRLAPARIDTEHSFVISLADATGTRKPPVLEDIAPLPVTSVKDSASTRTHVLAQNDGLTWTQNIGDDAEMLALARVMNAAPGAGRRTLLLAGGLALVAALLAAVAFGPEIEGMWRRAMSGKKVETGALVVKTAPSGADVVLDGKKRGKSNIKITGIDVDQPHQLVVTPIDREPIVIEFSRADFVQGDDGLTYFFDKNFQTDAGP